MKRLIFLYVLRIEYVQNELAGVFSRFSKGEEVTRFSELLKYNKGSFSLFLFTFLLFRFFSPFRIIRKRFIIFSSAASKYIAEAAIKAAYLLFVLCLNNFNKVLCR